MAERTHELGAWLGRVALGLVPAAVLGTAFWPQLSTHPAAAFGAFVGYAVLVGALAYLSTVASVLQRRWGQRTGDAIDRRVRLTLSRFERAYRDGVRAKHRFIDLQGLATRSDFTPKLEKVFVDVSLIRRPPHLTTQVSPVAGGIPSGTAESGEPARRSSVTAYLGQEEASTLAVIGAPGTGKTTLLKHLAVRPPRRGARGRTALPILLHLHNHAARIAEDPRVTLPDVVRSSLGDLGRREPPGWFERQLTLGRCLVLLDGLDEVARDADRREVSSWVERQIEVYERNDFVLTSRPHGYQSAPVNRALVLQVQRFTGEQISRFVHSWYRAVEELSTRERGAEVTARADEDARDLLARLRDRPTLYDLAANPLLLTMTAHVHRYLRVLPGSRAELYSEICQVLLWQRQEAKKIRTSPHTRITGEQKEVVLRELAYAMMSGRQRDVGAGSAARTLAPVLERVSITLAAEEFLRLVADSGLLVERERGRYSFAHLTLQEYLAARHIQHHGLGDRLRHTIEDDWWRETTLLYAARNDPAPIVRACLARDSTTALALAFDCEEVATEFDRRTARALESLRRDALAEPVGSARRRLLTAVSVTRALAHTVHLSDEVRLSAQPVPREVFRLFLASGFRRDHYEPATGQLRSGPPQSPALGVTRRQAAAFLAWVDLLLPGGVTYRLPTRAEISDPSFTSRAPRHTYWYRGTGRPTAGPAALWVPDDTPHPWSATLPDPDAWPDDATLELLRAGQVGLTHARTGELIRALDGARRQFEARTEPRQLLPAHGVVRRLVADLELAREMNPGADRATARAVCEVHREAADLADAIDRARHTDLAFDLDHHVGRERAAQFSAHLTTLCTQAGVLASRPVLRDLAHRLRTPALVHAVLRAPLSGRAARDPLVPPDSERTVAAIRQVLAEPHPAQVVAPDALCEAFAAPSGGPNAASGPVLRSPGRRRAAIGGPRSGAGRTRRAGARGPGTGADPDGRGGTEDGAPLDLLAPAADAEDARRRLTARLSLLAAEAQARAERALSDRDLLPPRTATALQLVALALTAAADSGLGDRERALRYRTAAVGATAHRRRAAGGAAPSEALVLARDTAL